MGSKNILLPPPALGGGGGGKDFPIKGTVIHPENFKPHSAREDGSEHCSMTNTAPKRDQFKTPNQHLLWL